MKLIKRLLLKLGIKNTAEDIHKFIESNSRFENIGPPRHWLLLNPDGSRKGFVWFKNLLGGWRLRLDSDKGNEWEERGVIDSIRKLKSYLK